MQSVAHVNHMIQDRDIQECEKIFQNINNIHQRKTFQCYKFKYSGGG